MRKRASQRMPRAWSSARFVRLLPFTGHGRISDVEITAMGVRLRQVREIEEATIENVLTEQRPHPVSRVAGAGRVARLFRFQPVVIVGCQIRTG